MLCHEPAWPEDGDAVALARAHHGPNAEPDDRTRPTQAPIE